MTIKSISGLLIFPLILLSACSSIDHWQSAYNRDHVLVGKIWSTNEARFVGQDELIADINQHDFVLLGETHNNPDHHILQAYIIKSLVNLGRRPLVAFEMLNMSQIDNLIKFSESYPKSSEEFFKAVNWENSGWPDKKLYTPIVDEALAANLKISPANISRKKTKRLMKLGLNGLSPRLIKQLRLNNTLPKILENLLKTEIQKSHCGYGPKNLLDKMVFTQFVKDAHMAWAIGNSRNQNGVVLIAGLGHVRKDWAVPFHFKRLIPNGTITTIAFLEVSQKGRDVHYYRINTETSELPYDYIWFTPRVEIMDACEKFKKQLKRMQTKSVNVDVTS